MFLNFDAMPPPLRGAARHPPALRPAGTVPPDMAPPERCPVVMVPLLRHCSTGHDIWCRLRPARFLAARLRSAFGGPALRGYAIPAGYAIPQSPQFVQVRNLSRRAIPQGTQSVKSASGGGDRRPDRAGGTVPGNCPARSMVPAKASTESGAAQRGGAKPPGKGQAQNRRRPCCPPARSGRRDGAANRRHGMVPPDWAARGMVPGNCPARSMVPPIGGTVSGSTEYGAAQWGGTEYGACNCRHGILSRPAVRRSHSCRIS